VINTKQTKLHLYFDFLWIYATEFGMNERPLSEGLRLDYN